MQANLLDEKIRTIQAEISKSEAKGGNNPIFIGDELINIDAAKEKIKSLVLEEEAIVQKTREIVEALSSFKFEEFDNLRADNISVKIFRRPISLYRGNIQVAHRATLRIFSAVFTEDKLYLKKCCVYI